MTSSIDHSRPSGICNIGHLIPSPKRSCPEIRVTEPAEIIGGSKIKILRFMIRQQGFGNTKDYYNIAQLYILVAREINSNNNKNDLLKA
jgi:hypothetical protein